ncbi:hypothetical protein Leryth_001080 [Lithospermum erythrorhizon]|nr:hypothetical protein Leryth_001080 [Lithospermum erythrorhizon]
MMAPPKSSSKHNNKPNNSHKPTKKQFKPKTKGKDTNMDDITESINIHIQEDAPDFPRGGGSSLSRAELEEIHNEVDGEFEGGDRFLKKKEKKGPRKSHSTEDDPGSLFGDGISGKLPRYTNKITFKNIAPGMKLWGVISEVNEKDIVVSLPGGLRGLVRSPEAFDPISDKEFGKLNLENISLSSVYHSGQLVSCIVLQVDDDKKEVGKRRIWLSLRLSLLHKSLTWDVIQEGMVLSAYVKSIEDHGYILHFGIHPFTGFMAKNNQTDNRETKLKIGQLVQGVVKSFDKTRKVVFLSSDTEVVSKCVTRDLKGISIDLLVPGMMVNAVVRATLENGVMLSFLTYFTGTVDMFNLQSLFPTSKWKDDYTQNKKVNARVLFIDPSTRAIGLTLNPHLVHNKAPPTLVKTGDIFDHSKVVRVDRGFGVLLEVLSLPVPTPAFVSVSDVADKEVKKLEKTFREGTNVRVRIHGFRNLEGLATGTLKMSAFEGSVFTHSDVKPGMVVKAKVIKVDTFGAILQLASGIKALCPLRHMSEFEITKPRTKFQVGAELVFRVLGCKSKRITVTHKKTLVKSKLVILTSYADATEGLTTHGWITKIDEHGCFVHFYNGVHGFAARSELGLDPGSDIRSMYHVEQVVKCRVTSAIPASKRINLSFRMTPARVNADDVKLGSIVSGVVERVTPHAVVVNVNAKGHTMGSISHEHLADHHDLAARMSSVLKPGFKFDKLLVLDVEGYNLILSAKYSLVESALQLPADASQVQPHSVVPGYVCNLIETGCFVRFVGRLTGFAPKNKATDDRRLDLSEVFSVGQSVRCNILDVNSDSGRITLSLKQSLTSSTDASFIQEYFILEEKIAKLQTLESGANDLTLVDQFNIGSVVEGQVVETKDFGAVINFPKYKDVMGFISHHQLAGTVLVSGSTIQAAVLDVSKRERLVDLSLKADFFTKQRAHKKRKAKTQKELEVNRNVNAIVEIVKEHYLVLSLPEYGNAIGFASLNDYNTQKLPPKQFSVGQSVIATIMALPTSSCGRLLLLLKSISEVDAASPSSKRAKRMSSYNVGSLVDAEITEIKPLELRLKFGSGFEGRVHITEVIEGSAVEKPFSNFKIGQTTKARIVYIDKTQKSGQGFRWELSIKPSLLLDSSDMEDELKCKDFNYSSGQQVTGYIYKVDREWAWLAISRNVNAKLFILDTGSEPQELEEFAKRFNVGQAVSGYISSVNKEKRLLRLVLQRLVVNAVSEGQNSVSDESFICRFPEGGFVGGRISKIFPGVGGMLVEIDNNRFGKVHYTELRDGWVSDPLSGYSEGQFVKCRVLEANLSAKGTVHVDLSLRSRSENVQHQSSHNLNNMIDSYGEPVPKVEDLHVNMSVQGYVKSVTSKGCFIMLSRKVDGKILLSNLSDNFIENPEKEFPVGKLVSGKVVAVEPLTKRVEVSLKTSTTTTKPKYAQSMFDSVSVGNIISGIVKRVEHFGLFIRIDGTNMDGLCHISEVSDEDAATGEIKYEAGERVTAKVLKVDKDRHRISLGMKASYFKNDAEERCSGQGVADNCSPEDARPTGMMQDCPLLSNIVDGSEEEKYPSLKVVESRASIPPLEVSLDSIEDLGSEDIENMENAGDPVHTDEHINKREKKKAKEQREQEISAAEKRLLEEDCPKNADEFEKLVRTSPNSSFVWIKYMDFLVKLADVEKAREIAERALKTINVREESEKLNVWIAYFNLENVHGKPPEEAVLKVFQRALQYCDPKKVHLALLRVYEEDKQDKLADELLLKMVKKFKQSCKVWLRRVQWLIIHENVDGVQAVINRALLSLPRHKHIKFITQTAILEFKNGVPERGRSMFEGILKEYPKRTDLWSVYLDQEIRLGDTDVIRTLFERATSLNLHPKKMKFLFKKYHKFEQSHGDDEKADYVKKKAIEYVETLV